MQDERYVASADLGSGKIAISVAKIVGDDIQIIYYKETPSDGIRHSLVFNPKKASDALRLAVKEAEHELNIKIRQIVVGLPRCDIHQEVAPARLERSEPDTCITLEEIVALKNMALDTTLFRMPPRRKSMAPSHSHSQPKTSSTRPKTTSPEPSAPFSKETSRYSSVPSRQSRISI